MGNKSQPRLPIILLEGALTANKLTKTALQYSKIVTDVHILHFTDLVTFCCNFDIRIYFVYTETLLYGSK